ncbi:MAG: hypothetical protein QM564_13755 [Bergeyella sp.]
MKTFIYYVFIFIIIACKNGKNNIKEYDYSNSAYDYYLHKRNIISEEAKTTITINNKVSNFSQLKKLYSVNKIKKIDVIKDSATIEKLKFSYSETKVLIIVEK